MQHVAKDQPKEKPKQDTLDPFFVQRRERSNTLENQPQGRISVVRASFMTKKPMENPNLDSLGLESVTRLYD